MNLVLKVLAAVTLAAVTVAAGVFTIKLLTAPSSAEVKSIVSPISGPGEAIKGNETPPVEKPVVETPDDPAPEPESKPELSGTIVVEKNDPLQPRYVPVNQPAYLQNLRMEGKSYHSRVMGKVSGQAAKKDWGIRGSAYFTYIYGIESVGKIVKNDGVTIVEERRFGTVTENVFVSRYDVGFELPPELGTGLRVLEILSGGTGIIGPTVVKLLNQVKIPVDDKFFNKLRDKKMLPQDLDPEKIKGEMVMFAKLKNGRILEGKTVRIVFRDGQGITSITPIGCSLSEQEVDVIKRTNYVMDHYLFPDQEIAIGSSWDVDGDVFAGFLDPRLQGKVDGKVTVRRVADFTDAAGEISRRLRLVNGHISFSDHSRAGKALTGQLNSVRGICSIPDRYGVITTASLSGMMDYRNVSTDHLLFAAEMTVTPRFEIFYECSVE